MREAIKLFNLFRFLLKNALIFITLGQIESSLLFQNPLLNLQKAKQTRLKILFALNYDYLALTVYLQILLVILPSLQKNMFAKKGINVFLILALS